MDLALFLRDFHEWEHDMSDVYTFRYRMDLS